MRLYGMELYKICSRRVFWLGILVSALILAAFFWFVEVGEEWAYADGKTYRGYEAVRQNRRLTRPFEGKLDDEKAERIIEAYGFPSRVEQNYPGFRRSNFLTRMIGEYLTDGYLYDWEDYREPSRLIPMEETELGAVERKSGKTVSVAYTEGWRVFLEMLQMGMILSSVLVMVGVSGVFSEERQVEMLPLLFTTRKGKKGDILAKVLASFSAAALLYLGTAVLDGILCAAVFGLEGADTMAGLVLSNLNQNRPMTWLPVSVFTGMELFLSLLALCFLCGITLFVSAKAGSAFQTLAVSAALWGLPVLLRIFFGGMAFIVLSGMPIFLVMTMAVFDISGFWYLTAAGAAATTGFLTVLACRSYRDSLNRSSAYFFTGS